MQYVAAASRKRQAFPTSMCAAAVIPTCPAPRSPMSCSLGVPPKAHRMRPPPERPPCTMKRSWAGTVPGVWPRHRHRPPGPRLPHLALRAPIRPHTSCACRYCPLCPLYPRCPSPGPCPCRCCCGLSTRCLIISTAAAAVCLQQLLAATACVHHRQRVIACGRRQHPPGQHVRGQGQHLHQEGTAKGQQGGGNGECDGC